ncbi:MAG: CPBP family glutamic-type intramembrane protease [Acidimicrobiia bacterium]
MRSARTRVQWSEWTDLRCQPSAGLLAALVVPTAAIAVWSGILYRPLGGPGFTPAFPAAVILATFVGWNQLGLSATDLRVWRETLLVIGALLAVVGIVFVTRTGTGAELLAFGIGALEEELVFRFAAPLALGGLTAWALGRPLGDLRAWGNGPCAVAVIGSAVVFTCMPGHLAQVDGPLTLVPFLAIAMLLTYSVLRTGALLPGIAVHALLNVATVAYLDGVIPNPAWVAVVIVGLGAYAWGAERAGRRLGLMSPMAT